MNIKSQVIAIDGPSGSGKSTITKEIAKRLELTYLDTGAMFRAIGLSLSLAGINSENDLEVETFLESMKFEYGQGSVLVSVNGVDLTTKIREHNVSGLASQYSQLSSVRTYLKKIQREIAQERPSILEGRDIGTVIFPNAALKVFLTASAKARAERRFNELKERGTLGELSFDKILKDIEERDLKDSSRAIAPLVKADDAIEVDTSELNIEEVIQKILGEFQTRVGDFTAS